MSTSEPAKLKYVSKDKYGYRYKPYKGRKKGKVVWGKSVYLCSADATNAELLQAYRVATKDNIEKDADVGETRQTSRGHARLKYVSKDRYGYWYKPYKGRANGKIVWGRKYKIALPDATEEELLQGYLNALKGEPVGAYTLGACARDALHYRSRKEWERGSGAIYRCAWLNNWLDMCCKHMRAGKTFTDNDVVYLWEREDYFGEGRIIKVGVTSQRVGTSRIVTAARKNGMQAKILLMLACDDAMAIESKILELGRAVDYDSRIDGATEFRLMTDAEVKLAVKTAKQLALDAVA